MKHFLQMVQHVVLRAGPETRAIVT